MEILKIYLILNDSIFGIKNENLNNNIQIYDSIKYEFIKNIDFNCNPKFIGVIKNELIIFNNSSKKQIFLVDAKYLEIMQIIGIEKNNYSLEIKNKYLLIFYTMIIILYILKKCIII